jgi:hypothetical protein
MKSLLFLVPVFAICASAALAAPMGGSMMGGTTTGAPNFAVPMLINDAQVRKANAMAALRNEGLKLRTADGGTLTPEHRQYLQARLDAIRAGDY